MAKDIEATSTEIEPKKQTYEEQLALFRQVAETMRAAETDDDPEAATNAVIARIMDAMSVDEILGSTVIGLKDMIGTPMTIERAELRESDFTEGVGAYAVMHVTNDAGEKLIVTTGSTNVLAALVKFQYMNAYPVRCMARESAKPTKSGYYVLSLGRAPDKVESF